MLRRLSFYYLCLVLFFLPLNFGSAVNIGEVSVFPLSGLEWLLAGWPPFLLSPLSGLALFLALISTTDLGTIPRRTVFPVAVWLALLCFSLFGLWNTTSWDFAIRFLFHLFSVFCLALAVFIEVDNCPGHRRWFLAALALGGLSAVLSGWQQVPGGGLQQTLEYAERMAQARGTDISASIRSRLERGRAFGPFIYPNSYAAHLVLTGPLLLFFFYRWGLVIGRWMKVEPTLAKLFRQRQKLPIWIGGLMVVAGLVLWGGALWFSGSRAAVAALVGGLMFSVLLRLRSRRTAIGLAVLALILGSLIFAVRMRGQDLASLDARFDYWQAASRMTVEKPLAGVGLGEFFHHYMRLKTAEMEETRIPHNGFLFFASQAGIPAGLVFCLIGLLPGAVLYFKEVAGRGIFTGSDLQQRLLVLAVGTGCMAWFLHSLTDFNIMIPGSVATMAVLPVLVLAGGAKKRSAEIDEGQNPADEEKREFCLSPKIRLFMFAFAGMALLPLLLWPGDKKYMQLSVMEVNVRTLPWFEQAVTEAARLNPLSPRPWQLLGYQAEKLNSHEVAAAAYRRAVRRSPQRAALWFGLARNELELGNRAAAKEAFHRGLQWYPEAPAAERLKERFRNNEG